jgi:hypothetical protein
MHPEDKLWDLANIITGFAIVQSLATTFAMAKGELRGSLKGKGDHIGAFICTSLFTVAYIVAIEWCSSTGKAHDIGHEKIWDTVNAGRIFAVILFTLLTLFTLLGHWNARPAKETHASGEEEAPPKA